MVLIEGERIKAVGPSLQVPRDVEITDLGDVTLLPGLIDAHTHMLLNTEEFSGNGNDFLAATLSTITTTQRALRGAGFAKDMLLEGFTTIRDLGNSGRGGDIALRDAINQGWVPGPRIVASTRILAPTGGQFGALAPETAGLIDLEYAVVNGTIEAKKAVRQAIYEGADVIKVVVKEAAASLDLEEMKAIVAEAHRASRKVAVHAYDDSSARVAVEAGVDSVEHGYSLSEATLRLMGQKSIWLVPTDLTVRASVSVFSKGQHFTPEEALFMEAYWAKREKTCEERLQMAKRLGVPLAAGSDVFFPVDGRGRGASSKTMFAAYSDEGLSPIEIIQMATNRAAELLGWADRVGSISPGKFADLIAVEGNPLKDIGVLDRVSFVMKGGQVVKNRVQP
jgi:imidazolonepropionase-like amidohydrolase